MSAIRFIVIAAERAPTMATTIQAICTQEGQAPANRAASSAPTNANGSANTECSILIISKTVRMRLIKVAPASLPASDDYNIRQKQSSSPASQSRDIPVAPASPPAPTTKNPTTRNTHGRKSKPNLSQYDRFQSAHDGNLCRHLRSQDAGRDAGATFSRHSSDIAHPAAIQSVPTREKQTAPRHLPASSAQNKMPAWQA